MLRPCPKLFGPSKLFSFRHSTWFIRFVKKTWFKKECKCKTGELMDVSRAGGPEGNGKKRKKSKNKKGRAAGKVEHGEIQVG